MNRSRRGEGPGAPAAPVQLPTTAWLTRRRALVVATLGILAAWAIAWNHRRAATGFVRNVGVALSVSAEMSADLLGDWFALHGGEAIVMREATFPRFNAAAPDDRTQRTILVEPRDGTLVVHLVSAPGGGPRPTGAVPAVPPDARVTPAWIAAVLDPAQWQRGVTSVGVTGTRVVRGVAPVPGTPYRLVRERDAGELLALVRPGLLVSDAILGLLAILILTALVLRWRATALRAERDAMALRSSFVSSVSHELRTPLTQIRMYAEMLQLGLLPDPEERARALEVIGREAGRLGVLVDQALAYVRDGQRPPVSPAAPGPVADAAARAVATLAPLLAERQVTVETDVSPDLRVALPPDQVQQVLLNLLANALKYGPVGQTIRMRGERRGAQVRVTVDDEGPGIPVSERQRVWQPFVRGAAVSDASGSGIGLAIVRDLVVAAGGSVAVDDAPDGRGARLVLALPAA